MTVFNPYFARPIGSRKFEEHLITLAVRNRGMAREESEMLADAPVTVMPAAHDAQAHRPLERGWYKLDALIRAEDYYRFLQEYIYSSAERKSLLKKCADELLESDGDWIYKELISIGKDAAAGRAALRRIRHFISQTLYGAAEEKTKGCGFN